MGGDRLQGSRVTRKLRAKLSGQSLVSKHQALGFIPSTGIKTGVVAEACDHPASEEQGEKPEGSVLGPLTLPTHHAVPSRQLLG